MARSTWELHIRMYICTCTRQAALDRWQQEVASVQYKAGILNIYIYIVYVGEPCCVHMSIHIWESPAVYIGHVIHSSHLLDLIN